MHFLFTAIFSNNSTFALKKWAHFLICKFPNFQIQKFLPPDYSFFYTGLLSLSVLSRKTMRIIVINGPNLNLLGTREPGVYGSQGFDSFFETLERRFPEHQLEYFQSNVEGEIINKLHETGFSYEGIVLNPGGYTHTSVAIADAIASIKTPVVEVHISNIYAREEIRHQSLTGKNCAGILTGFGLEGYTLGLHYLTDYHSKRK